MSEARIAAPHDPGGRRRLLLPAGVIGKATFGGSACEYRYVAEYRREDLLSPGNPQSRMLVIMMNPSVADAMAFDPTLAKCWRACSRLGFSTMTVGNTFAYRATDQKSLASVADPVGPDNDRHLAEMAARADLIIMAFGTPQIPALRSRGPDVMRNLMGLGHALHTFALSRDGRPCHPLYLKEPLVPTELTRAA